MAYLKYVSAGRRVWSVVKGGETVASVRIAKDGTDFVQTACEIDSVTLNGISVFISGMAAPAYS